MTKRRGSAEERARAAVERIKAEQAAEEKRIEGRLAELRREAEKRREGEAAEERKRAARRAEREAQGQRAEEERVKREMFGSWVANGGAPSEFEAAWPEIKAERLKRLTLENENEARELHRARGISRI